MKCVFVCKWVGGSVLSNRGTNVTATCIVMLQRAGSKDSSRCVHQQKEKEAAPAEFKGLLFQHVIFLPCKQS